MRSIDGLSTISCRFQVVAETVGTRCGLKSGKDACQVVFKLFQGFGPLGTFTLLASLSSLGTKGDYCVAEAIRGAIKMPLWRLATHNHNLDSKLTEF